MNLDKYPWLLDLSSHDAVEEISEARAKYMETGAGEF
jgi:hypothetical protein